MIMSEMKARPVRRQLKNTATFNRRRFRGTSLVELSLVLPIFLFLFAGLMDVARGYSMSGIVTNAAREGARYGATHPSDTSGIKVRVQEEVQNAGLVIDPGKVLTTYPDGGPVKGQRIKVEVAYSYRTFVGGIIGRSSLDIRRSCTMAIL